VQCARLFSLRGRPCGGKQAYRHTGIPAYRHTGIPAYRHTGIPAETRDEQPRLILLPGFTQTGLNPDAKISRVVERQMR